MCVTGLTVRHVGERFQWVNNSIAKYVIQLECSELFAYSHLFCCRYFKEMLAIFSSPPFYNKYVQMPNVNNPIPPEIRDNPKRFPFFRDTVGALDGTHINCSPNQQECEVAHNRKGLLTQNCLVACSFDLFFLYVLSGWEGSVSDSLLFHTACQTSFPIPPGKYYLADAGFPLCDHLLVPYRGVRYHLAEWGRAQIR